MKTKNLFIGIFAFAIFFSTPAISNGTISSDDDVEQAGGYVIIPGTLFLDGKILKLKSTACEYGNGVEFTLGGILDNSNKANKKANKKAAKEVAKEIKAVKKAGGSIEGVEIKGFLGQGSMEGILQPKQVRTPMKQPVVTGLAPAADAYLLLIWGLYEATQNIKEKCRVLTIVPEGIEEREVDGVMMEFEKFQCYDAKCNKLTPEEALALSNEAKKVYNEAGLVVAANLVALGGLAAALSKANAEAEGLDMLNKVAALASITQAVARQAMIMSDNKRIQDYVKASKKRIEQLQSM